MALRETTFLLVPRLQKESHRNKRSRGSGAGTPAQPSRCQSCYAPVWVPSQRIHRFDWRDETSKKDRPMNTKTSAAIVALAFGLGLTAVPAIAADYGQGRDRNDQPAAQD